MTILLVFCFAPVIVAQETAVPPEIELLEFLGEWSASDQLWLEQQQQQLEHGDKTEVDVGKTATQTEVNDHE